MRRRAHTEAKLVRATLGRISDVAVDLRPDSPTFRAWTGVELDAESGRALLIGEGMAHGFLTLEDDSDVLYQINRIFRAGPWARRALERTLPSGSPGRRSQS